MFEPSNLASRPKERRANMHSLKNGLVLLTLAAMPLSAHALKVEVCVPTCALDPSPRTLFSDAATHTVTDFVAGLSTTTFPLVEPANPGAPIVHGPFTISGTVTAEQSGTLQKIVFNPTTITANSSCTTTNQCRLQIIATSDGVDFPFAKPVGGYPAGVFMAGSFSNTAQPRHQSPPNPNGDTISMTGEASGLGFEGEALGNSVINPTPGTSVGDTPTTLPAFCSGTEGCKFTATSSVRSFNEQMQETVQQVCPDSEPCLTRLKTTVNVNMKRPGNVTLPAGTVTVTPTNDPNGNPINQLEVLLAENLPPLGSFVAQRLLVGRQAFALTARLKLGSGATINPPAEELYFRVGNFNMTIGPNKFRRFLDGKLFTFFGKVDGKDVAASLVRDFKDPTAWTFLVGVGGVALAELLPPLPNQTPVDVSIGGDTGSDLVLATFF